LNGVDEIVLSLYAKGPTTGEISAHFAEIFGASVSKETISRITQQQGRRGDDRLGPPAPLGMKHCGLFPPSGHANAGSRF
jgi:hypothetical protein